MKNVKSLEERIVNLTKRTTDGISGTEEAELRHLDMNGTEPRSIKVVHAKITTVADRMYYNLADGATASSSNRLEANQVFRVYLMDNDGDYIQIPRLVDKNLLLADITREANLNAPD